MYMAYTSNPKLPKLRMEAVRLVRSGQSIRQVARHYGYEPIYRFTICFPGLGSPADEELLLGRYEPIRKAQFFAALFNKLPTFEDLESGTWQAAIYRGKPGIFTC